MLIYTKLHSNSCDYQYFVSVTRLELETHTKSTFANTTRIKLLQYQPSKIVESRFKSSNQIIKKEKELVLYNNSRLLYAIAKIAFITAEDHSFTWFHIRSSIYAWFISYIISFVDSFITGTFEPTKDQLATSVASYNVVQLVRASHRYREVTGSNPVEVLNVWRLFCFVLFCFVLFYFILFYFILFCFVLFCFVLFCFVLFCFVLFRFVSVRFVSFRFVSFRFVLFCFVLFCFILFCFQAKKTPGCQIHLGDRPIQVWYG